MAAADALPSRPLAAGQGKVHVAVNVEQAAAGDDVLDLRAAVLRDQPAQQRDLALVGGGKVGVAALGRQRDETAVDIVQHRHAETGAGGNQADVARWNRFPGLQHLDFRFVERRHTVSHRFEIVQQGGAFEAEALRDGAGVDRPRHVGQVRDTVHHRAGGAETGALDPLSRRRRRSYESVDDGVEAVVVARRETVDRRRARTRPRALEQTEQRLGSTDVAGEQHA